MHKTSPMWVFTPPTLTLLSLVTYPILLQFSSLHNPPFSPHFGFIANMHFLECKHSWECGFQLLGP